MISSFSSFKYDDGKLLWGESRQELDFFLSFSSRSDSFLVACTISGRIFPHFPFNSVLSTRKQYFRSLFTIYDYWKQRRDLIHNTVMAIRYEKKTCIRLPSRGTFALFTNTEFQSAFHPARSAWTARRPPTWPWLTSTEGRPRSRGHRPRTSTRPRRGEWRPRRGWCPCARSPESETIVARSFF